MASPNHARPRSHSMSDFMRARQEQEAMPLSVLQDLMAHVESAAAEERRRGEFADQLPRLTEAQLAALGHSDSPCPICLTPLVAVVAEEETALAHDSPAHAAAELGVTRLVDTCGHVFCRKDIRNWIREGHTTCPTCRTPVLSPPAADAPPPPSSLFRQFAPTEHLDADDIPLLFGQPDVPPDFSETLRGLVSALGRAAQEYGVDDEPAEGAGERGARERQEWEEDRDAFSGMYS